MGLSIEQIRSAPAASSAIEFCKQFNNEADLLKRASMIGIKDIENNKLKQIVEFTNMCVVLLSGGEQTATMRRIVRMGTAITVFGSFTALAQLINPTNYKNIKNLLLKIANFLDKNLTVKKKSSDGSDGTAGSSSGSGSGSGTGTSRSNGKE